MKPLALQLSLIFGLFGALTSCSLNSSLKEDPSHCQLGLKNATVVDPATQREFRANIALSQGHILEVDETLQAHECDQELDLKGFWVIPGLTDLHVHAWGNPSPTTEDQIENNDDEYWHEKTSQVVLKAGVTALLDLGGDEAVLLPLRDRLKTQDKPAHAEFFSAGPVFVESQTRKHIRGQGPRIVSSPEDARQQVREIAIKQPDVIKIISDHANERGAMRPSILKALITEARAQGLKTVVHIGNWTDAKNAILDGATAVTHLFDEELIPAEVAQLYSTHHVLSIPTLAVHCDFIRYSQNPSMLDSPLLQAVTGPKLVSSYRDHEHYSKKAHFFEEWQTEGCIPYDLKSLKRLDEAGVQIAAGSDSGNLGVIAGYSVHREMALMVEAGMTPWKALASATTIPGEFLGRHFGIERGDVANLVVLSGDPIAKIQNTELVTHVILHGVLVF